MSKLTIFILNKNNESLYKIIDIITNSNLTYIYNIFIININRNFIIRREYDDIVTVCNYFEYWNVSRLINYSIMFGFNSLDNPMCNYIVCVSDDCILNDDWHKYIDDFDFLYDGNLSTFFICITPSHILNVGLFDETLHDFGIIDYFLRSKKYKISINSHDMAFDIDPKKISQDVKSDITATDNHNMLNDIFFNIWKKNTSDIAKYNNINREITYYPQYFPFEKKIFYKQIPKTSAEIILSTQPPVNKNIKKQMKPIAKNDVKKQIKPKKNDVKKQVKTTAKNDIKKQVKPKIKNDVKKVIKTNIKNDVKKNITEKGKIFEIKDGLYSIQHAETKKYLSVLDPTPLCSTSICLSNKPFYFNISKTNTKNIYTIKLNNNMKNQNGTDGWHIYTIPNCKFLFGAGNNTNWSTFSITCANKKYKIRGFHQPESTAHYIAVVNNELISNHSCDVYSDWILTNKLK